MIKRKQLQPKRNIPKPEYEDNSDFYHRWYAKSGKPQTRTMPADKFMKRLREMIEFE